MPHFNLSVCLPNYNHAHFIEEAIEAILAQDYTVKEIIVIDDASTDNSVDIIQRFITPGGPVRLIRNPSNQGPCKSINTGIAEAQGEYVHVAAADDRVLPGFFSGCMNLLKRYPEAGLCASAVKFVDETGVDQHRPRLWSLDVPHIQAMRARDFLIKKPRFLNGNDVLVMDKKQPTFLAGAAPVIFRRDALMAAGGFREDLGVHADWFAVHYVAFRYGMCYLPGMFVDYRIVSTSFGHRSVGNAEKLLQSNALTLRTMCQGENRRVFPEAFTAIWRRRFSYTAVRSVTVMTNGALLDSIQRVLPPRTAFSRLLLWAIYALMRIEQLIVRVYSFRNIPSALRENA